MSNQRFYFTDLKDDFRTTPSDTDATSGGDLVLRCSPPRGHPAPVVRWVKDGEGVEISSDRRVTIGGGEGGYDLHIMYGRGIFFKGKNTPHKAEELIVIRKQLHSCLYTLAQYQ